MLGLYDFRVGGGDRGGREWGRAAIGSLGPVGWVRRLAASVGEWDSSSCAKGLQNDLIVKPSNLGPFRIFALT
jgi:hypothetical protein